MPKSVDLLILKSYVTVCMIFISVYIRLLQEMKSWDAINMVQLATFALNMQHKLAPRPIIHPTVQLFIVGPDDTYVHTVQQ